MGRKLTLLLLCLLMMTGMGKLSAQVTVGSDVEPEKAALLELKDQEADADNVTSTTGGMLLPRVKLERRTELNPFIGGASDDVKRLHTGLMVFNLEEVEDEELSIGINYWDGKKWNPLIAKEVPKAVFAILSCEAVQIDGEYKVGTPLNSGNVMKVTVNVTRPGTYTILAKADPHNGYYFSVSGEFQVTGTYEVLAMGAGTPVNPKEGSNLDNVYLELNGERVDECPKQLEIKDTALRPKFELSCSSVKVNGVYKVNKALDGTNTITIKINVQDGTQGAPYRVYTNQVGGIKFEGTGVLSGAGSYTITLSGSGTPTDLTAKNLTITTNSESSSVTCSAVIQPVVPQKSIVAIGAVFYGLTGGGTQGCNNMIKDRMNFGSDVNSIVKYEGFTNVTVETGMSDAIIGRYTGENGTNQPYDIILITYDLRPFTANQRQWLTNYVNKGGVLIYLDQGVNDYNADMIASIFGTSRPSYAAIGTNTNYVTKFTDVDDEILNGPFGDVRGKQWGDDYGNSCGLTVIPNGAIVYSGAVNAYTGSQGGGSAANVKVSMMRHPTKNFFWCGDSGLINAEVGGNLTGPFRIGSKTIGGVVYPNYPADKPNYGSQPSANRLPVSNSTLFANVMAWALRVSSESGINSNK